jgi:hypothetical protein
MDRDQEEVLVEALTEGRGGAFFYFSQDRSAVVFLVVVSCSFDVGFFSRLSSEFAVALV